MSHLLRFTTRHRQFGFLFLVSLVAALGTTALTFAQLTPEDIAVLQEQGEKEGWTFTVLENPATKYSLDELCGLKVPANWQAMAPFDPCTPKGALPVTFDWRDSSGCTPVKDQDGCGSCWAFGTVGPLECNIKIKDGQTVDLSEQWLVSCNSDGWDCGGGWFAHNYHEWKTDPCDSTGAVFEADFPYVAWDAPCNCPYPHPYRIESWAYVGNDYSVPSVAAMKQAILDYGPISVAVYANSAMQAYGGGVFNGCGGGQVNHAIVLVGWDDNQGTEGVWFMRNSWGQGWGEDGGYMRIPYDCSSIGYAACYINYAGTKTIAFEYPNGIPTTVIPGQATSFEVIVSGVSGGVPVPGSGQLHYAINGGSVETVSMTETSPNHYEATLPALSCDEWIEFYVSAEEVNDGRIYDPDPSSPNIAIPATAVTTVFEDDFETDKGWSVSGDASDGQWDRGVPVGGGDRGDPPTDFDGSGKCYLTDNVYGNSDVDGGTTILTSPAFDLSTGNTQIHYARWYSNNYGADPHNDVFEVYISNDNGSNWVLVETVGPVEQASGGWYEHTFWVSDFITPSSQVRLRFDASDLSAGSVIEAAVDAFTVTTYECGPSTPQIITETLPDWTVGSPYSQQLEASGGTGALTWSDKYGDLAGTGLTLSATGLLSGTPLAGGQISFTAEVTDEEMQSDEKLFSFFINPELEIITESLPDWTAGHPYSHQLQVTGGTGTKTWSDKYNNLAGTGLTLSTSGLLSGTPVAGGQISFTAEVTDETMQSYEKVLSFFINPELEIVTDSLPDWTVGLPYSQQLQATGGTGTKTWSDKYVNLAGTGLTLSATGLLSGIPVAGGQISFTAEVTDEVMQSDNKIFSFFINPELQIVTDSLPDWTVGQLYIQQLQVTGGTGTNTWSDKYNDLEGTGLTLSATGLLSGTPLDSGQISFTAEVTDEIMQSDEQLFSFFINALPQILTDSLPDWTVGQLYLQQLQATGGTGTLTWTDKYSDLIGTGLTLSATGLLSGTPVSTGQISFTARVTDQTLQSDVEVFSFFINAELEIVTVSLPDWTVGLSYNQQLEATGGTGTKTWSDKYDDLAGTGLSLSATGLVSGVPTSTGTISFTAQVSDEVGASEEKPLAFTVNTAVAIVTDSLPSGTEGEPYSQQLEAGGGTGAKTWSDKNSDLQGSGLNLAADGLLSGTPVDTGTISFTARVEDAVGSVDEKLFSFVIEPSYICGDVDGDGIGPNVADLAYLVEYLFNGGPPPPVMEAADVNGDGRINVADLAALVDYLFGDGTELNCN
jgi:C1A family cysteine protease